ncbi:MAG: NfeD family protein [Clostridia bacterium]|nr:NfeD family protein [Clostridia bacterium]
MLMIWIALAVIFAIAEAISVQLVSVWFALGALAAMFLSLFGVDNPGIQIAVFLGVSIAALVATRPLAKKLMQKRVQPTNADRSIGQTGRVTKEINNALGQGEVNLKGVIWTARSCDEDLVIPENTLVTALRIEGVKLIVAPTESKEEIK